MTLHKALYNYPRDIKTVTAPGKAQQWGTWFKVCSDVGYWLTINLVHVAEGVAENYPAQHMGSEAD
jgi:hypothetical protein